jgi:putative transposase
VSAVIEHIPVTGVVAILAALGLSVATFYRRQKPTEPKKVPRPRPVRALGPDERQAVLDVLYEERFRDLPPAEIVAELLGEGRYLGSERTMYRVLAANHEVKERRNQLTHPVYAKPELIATGPNQVWSWDITKLLTFEKFVYLYLYVVMDIFSRYVVGWMLADKENAALATRLIEETIAKHDAVPGKITLHADRGAPMRSKLLAELLAKLDVVRSFSRPYTSNDNAFSESGFKTLKYHPSFPKKFHGDIDGRAFCKPYFDWYNNDHHHGGIGLLTPAEVHFGRAEQVLKRRHDVKMTAYHEHPERFVSGPPRLQKLPGAVYINPPSSLEVVTTQPVVSNADQPPLIFHPATSARPSLATRTVISTGGDAH